jgi:hypothetical protein
MNYIKKLPILFVLICLAFGQAGCSREYEVWLYNFSNGNVSILNPDLGSTLEPGRKVILREPRSDENVLFPFSLKLKIAGERYCYSLDRIKIGGYAQRTDGRQIVRLKLAPDNRIFVYQVGKDEFDPSNAVGDQPKGYPVSPSSCP